MEGQCSGEPAQGVSSTRGTSFSSPFAPGSHSPSIRTIGPGRCRNSAAPTAR